MGAVVDRPGRQLRQLFPDPVEGLRGEQAGKDDVPFQLDGADLPARVRLAQSVSSRRARALSSLLLVNDASMAG